MESSATAGLELDSATEVIVVFTYPLLTPEPD